tara:strand:+ start:1245 stop:1466 length:222 start_codon:yes stop_codon:yes gene_type:complete
MLITFKADKQIEVIEAYNEATDSVVSRYEMFTKGDSLDVEVVEEMYGGEMLEVRLPDGCLMVVDVDNIETEGE